METQAKISERFLPSDVIQRRRKLKVYEDGKKTFNNAMKRYERSKK